MDGGAAAGGPAAVVIRDVAYVLCEGAAAEVVGCDGSVLRWEAGSADRDLLAVCGEVFERGDARCVARPWSQVAEDLARLPPEPAAYSRHLEGLQGRFWLAHVRRAPGGLCALLAVDAVGTLQMWLSAGPGSCLASPHWRPAGLPAATGLLRHAV